MRKISFNTVLLILILVFCVTLAAERVTTLEGLAYPQNIYVHENQVFVIDFPQVYVYDAGDYHLVKQFGRRGEGPGEFLRFARLHFRPKFIIVQSENKLAYFSKDFKFVKEQKVPISFSRGMHILDDVFVVAHSANGVDDPRQLDQTINVYDRECKKIKEIFRQKYYFQITKDINMIYLPEVQRRTGIRCFVHNRKVFFEGEDGETGNIHVLDFQGNKLYTISHRFPKIEVTDQHVKEVEDFFKMKRRRILDILKQRKQLFTPDTFPMIHYSGLHDGKIYTIPYKREKGKSPVAVFQPDGKLIRKTTVSLVKEDRFSFYPFTIKNNKVYQLVENEDDEWDLNIYSL